MVTATGHSAPSDPAGELRTTQVTQADIKWLRSAKVEWNGCEAGAPIIIPTGMLFSQRKQERLGTLLPVFFLHARFAPGIYKVGADKAFEVTPEHIKLALLHKSKKVDMTPTPDAATPQQAPPPLWGTQVA